MLIYSKGKQLFLIRHSMKSMSNRKEFLKHSVLAGTAVAWVPLSCTPGMKTPPPARIVAVREGFILNYEYKF
jgi:hypothetical protein